MILDNDENIIETQGRLAYLYKCVESHVRVYFLSGRSMDYPNLSIPYWVRNQNRPKNPSRSVGDYDYNSVNIMLPYEDYLYTPIMDNYHKYLKIIWDKFLQKIKGLDLDDIYMNYDLGVKAFPNLE